MNYYNNINWESWVRRKCVIVARRSFTSLTDDVVEKEKKFFSGNFVPAELAVDSNDNNVIRNNNNNWKQYTISKTLTLKL